jgi:dCTP diphosphatase
MNIKDYQDKIRSFIHERDWEQFHNPKNLVMALSVEAGELVEIFQWLTLEQSANIAKSEEDKKSVEDEIADVFVYLLRLCDQLDIDLEKALNKKIIKNGEKYPVTTSKGIATKYNQKS